MSKPSEQQSWSILEHSGVVVVDKPAGWTSHDVVAKLRGAFGTRRVGHSGTLDPMATGVLVVGIERGTKFLAHVVDHEKKYDATVLLGASTLTDDAEGDVLSTATEQDLDGQSAESITAAFEVYQGKMMQKPAQVSSVKINGKRAHELVREGVEFDIPAREIDIYSLTVNAVGRVDGSDLTLPEKTSESVHEFVATPPAPLWEVKISVHSSTGTYIRSIARDVGETLGTGGFLTQLRRTQAGPFTIGEAQSLESILADPELSMDLDTALTTCFPVREITESEGKDLGLGKWLEPVGNEGIHAAVTPSGQAIALISEEGKRAKSVFVARPEGLS